MNTKFLASTRTYDCETTNIEEEEFDTYDEAYQWLKKQNETYSIDEFLITEFVKINRFKFKKENSHGYNWKCDCCMERFTSDEVVLLNSDNIVQDEEHGGSGDIDSVLCNECYEELYGVNTDSNKNYSNSFSSEECPVKSGLEKIWNEK